jgi:hypothetical protein
MDDGQKVKSGGITLCTDSFTLEEVKYLINSLRIIFGLHCTIHYKKTHHNKIYYRIYINRKEFQNIKSYLIPYIHATMLYKLNN